MSAAFADSSGSSLRRAFREATRFAGIAAPLFRHQWSGWPVLAVRAGFLTVLLTVFSRIWASALASTPGSTITATDAVWYIALTETVMLSVPLIHHDMEDDVANGGIETRLSRPMGYLAGRWAEGAAAFVARALVNGALVLILAPLLAGGWPRAGSGIWLAPLAIACAGACALAWGTLVGTAAFWMRQTAPSYWIYQKFLMLFGGLLIPLAAYPLWMQDVGAWLPFHDMLGGIGEMALGADASTTLLVCARLVGWTALGAIVSGLALRAGLAKHQKGA